MFKRLCKDIQVIKDRDPAARNIAEILLCYSGLHAIWAHRLSHFFYTHKWFVTYHFQYCPFFHGYRNSPGCTNRRRAVH